MYTTPGDRRGVGNGRALPWTRCAACVTRQIQFWKTLEGPSTVKEHVIVYEERKECLTPASSAAGAGATARGVRSTGHVYNLWPATTVSARIVAVNGNYEGLPSATVTFRTNEGGQCSLCSRSDWSDLSRCACCGFVFCHEFSSQSVQSNCVEDERSAPTFATHRLDGMVGI